MKKYYIVYIKDEYTTLNTPILCESITKINTSKYGKAHIFRDVITEKIIRPYYDTTLDKIYNNAFGTLTYNNQNKNYIEISMLEALRILKSITTNIVEEQHRILNAIEEKNISKKYILKNNI